jgi:hypothetical protein
MKSLMPLKNRQVVQNAWVVRNIDEAMQKWTRTLGIGPFLELPPMVPDKYVYRNANLRPDIRVALAQSGEVQIELIQVLTDCASIYEGALASGESAFHHVCIFTDDVDADLAHHEALGLEIPVVGHHGDVRFAFVDARPALGCMLEIITDSPLIRGIYGAVRRASDTWDGSDPVRPFTM